MSYSLVWCYKGHILKFLLWLVISATACHFYYCLHHTLSGVAREPWPSVSCLSPTESPRKILETTYWRRETGGRGGEAGCGGALEWKASWVERKVVCGTGQGPCAPESHPAGGGTRHCGEFPVAEWMAHLRGPPSLQHKGKITAVIHKHFLQGKIQKKFDFWNWHLYTTVFWCPIGII